MPSARLSTRQRRVLATINAATAGDRSWVSGYDVFAALQTSARFGATNHGRVFNALRTLNARQLVRVRIESVPGSGQRATYRLTDLGESVAAGEVGA
ncbi:MAG: hypothetical protein QOH99_1183 [Frankiaceae bacterium]|nr:hypothetical protein [Frankiaceae bacterium]